jgi:hypothetical protein
MKLSRSTLAIAAVSLAALTLYFVNAAPIPVTPADSTPTDTAPNPSDLAQGRTLVLNAATLVTEMASAKKRIADLWGPRDADEAANNPRTAGDGDLVDATPSDDQVSVRKDRSKPTTNKQAASNMSAPLDVVEG